MKEKIGFKTSGFLIRQRVVPLTEGKHYVKKKDHELKHVNLTLRYRWGVY